MDQADAGVQVLVLDDCSTDGSWALMQQLDQRWPARLQLMQHERNAGLSAARNTMIEAATGRLPVVFWTPTTSCCPARLPGCRPS